MIHEWAKYNLPKSVTIISRPNGVCMVHVWPRYDPFLICEIPILMVYI